MTGSTHNHQTGDFQPDGLVQRLFLGPSSAAYRLVVWAFVLGSASHLWLLDAWQLDWVPANLVYVAGLIALIFGGGSAGWWLCAVGLAIPLLFLRDQLTQSMFLLFVSVAGGLLTFPLPRSGGGAERSGGGAERSEAGEAARRPPQSPRNRGEAGEAPRRPPQSPRKRGEARFLWTVRWLMIATYSAAAFHKLNHDYFTPEYGCTSYGFVELADYYRLSADLFSFAQGFHAPFAVALELGIPLAYVLGRRHFARLLAVAFHIPLTVTMAPAFAFVMFVGHAAWITDGERAALYELLKRRARVIVGLGLALTVASLALHGALPEVTMIPREFLLWMSLVWLAAGYFDREYRAAASGSQFPRSAAGFVGPVLLFGFVVNCFTPYLGIQYQHTAAMLSNLRIDSGCWNHFIVPESVRLTDDYVGVDEVWFGEPGRVAEYEQIVLEQLWSPPQILQMRRNWCRPEVRPFHMAGTFRDRRWSIDDLCDPDEPWPFEDAGIFGVELFDGYLRFQKNLMRECPQTCIH